MGPFENGDLCVLFSFFFFLICELAVCVYETVWVFLHHVGLHVCPEQTNETFVQVGVGGGGHSRFSCMTRRGGSGPHLAAL